jgi:hypothetical protein
VGVALSLQMIMVSTQGKRKNQTVNALIISKTFFRRKKSQYYFAIIFLRRTQILHRGKAFDGRAD